MELWFVIALLSLALLIAVALLMHHMQLVRALKRLLQRLLALWSQQNASQGNGYCVPGNRGNVRM